jgi:hypothetical protein
VILLSLVVLVKLSYDRISVCCVYIWGCIEVCCSVVANTVKNTFPYILILKMGVFVLVNLLK